VLLVFPKEAKRQMIYRQNDGERLQENSSAGWRGAIGGASLSERAGSKE